MLTISTFASLAQLGAGLALALALFLEPIQYYDRRYRQRLEGSLKLIAKNGSDISQQRENEIWGEIVNLDVAVKAAKKMATWPMYLIKLGAAINFCILLLATVFPEATISNGWTVALLIFSIGPIVVGYIAISMIAKMKISKLDR